MTFLIFLKLRLLAVSKKIFHQFVSTCDYIFPETLLQINIIFWHSSGTTFHHFGSWSVIQTEWRQWWNARSLLCLVVKTFASLPWTLVYEIPFSKNCFFKQKIQKPSQTYFLSKRNLGFLIMVLLKQFLYFLDSANHISIPQLPLLNLGKLWTFYINQVFGLW